MIDQREIKSFKDLIFKPRKLDIEMRNYRGFKLEGKKSGQARLDFDNGYGVSVIRGYGTYGYEKGLYEMAVIYNGHPCYETPITDDVLGYLTPREVSKYMKEVQLLSTPSSTDAK